MDFSTTKTGSKTCFAPRLSRESGLYIKNGRVSKNLPTNKTVVACLLGFAYLGGGWYVLANGISLYLLPLRFDGKVLRVQGNELLD